MGAAAKAALLSHGFDSFLAHDDLQVSDEWKDRILLELQRVDVFVALLSSEFVKSKWCAQEVGVIVTRPQVLIIPISLDGTMPYGFISHLQATWVRGADQFSSTLGEVLLRRRPRLMIPRQIEKIRSATSFRHAEAIVRPLVMHFASFEDAEVNMFVSAVAENRKVWDAGLCRDEFIPEFVQVNGQRISPELADGLKAVLPELRFPYGGPGDNMGVMAVINGAGILDVGLHNKITVVLSHQPGITTNSHTYSNRDGMFQFRVIVSAQDMPTVDALVTNLRRIRGVVAAEIVK